MLIWYLETKINPNPAGRPGTAPLTLKVGEMDKKDKRKLIRLFNKKVRLVRKQARLTLKAIKASRDNEGLDMLSDGLASISRSRLAMIQRRKAERENETHTPNAQDTAPAKLV